jgi:acyl-CoA thioesterase-1
MFPLSVEVSFMWPFRLRPARPGSATSRQYGKPIGPVQRFAQRAALTIACGAAIVAAVGPVDAATRAVKIVALGDSLTAGLGLKVEAAFPAQLERALKAKGLAVEVANAGVSGDTASDGLARLDWAVPDGTDAVIVELGANDMLRGLDPQITRSALGEIVRRLKERRIAVLLAGMRASPNMGADYTRAFDAIFPELASHHGVVFYPFFLDGVAADRILNQPDGMHPSAAGVEAIVSRILPTVERLVTRLGQQGRI